MKGKLWFTIYDVLKKLLTRVRSNQFLVEVYMVMYIIGIFFLVFSFFYFRSYRGGNTVYHFGSISIHTIYVINTLK